MISIKIHDLSDLISAAENKKLAILHLKNKIQKK